MAGTVFLEGENINLRTIEEEDLEFLRNGVNHPEVRFYMGNRIPQNLETEQKFFENVLSNEEDVHLLICKDKERVGIISLKQEGDKAEKMAEIGIWLHPKHHGNGYGTEASKLITDYAFKQLNYHRVYARAYDGNTASQRIWEKLGFTEEGTLRHHTYTQGEHKDVVYYGILQGEWE